jgi:hypothetical protein
MEQPFEIRFDFPLASSDLIISLSATAELHHSDPWYRVDNFRFADNRHHENISPVLPPIEIKQIQQGSLTSWVHRDSEKETLLSMAAGNAIERVFQK